MKLNRTGSIWNRSERIKINDNWDMLEGLVTSTLEDLYNDSFLQKWLSDNKIDVKDSVDRYEDLPDTAEIFELRGVLEDNSLYLFDGKEWKKISSFNFNELEKIMNDLKHFNAQQVKNFNNVKVHQHLPLKFKAYDTIINITGASYLHPQGLALDEEYIYVMYDGSGTNKRVLVVYDKDANFIRCFIIGNHRGENIHVENENDKRFVYAKSDTTKLAKYDITNLTPSDTVEELKPIIEYEIPLYTNFFKIKDGWAIEYRDIVSSSDNTLKRNTLIYYDEEFKSMTGVFTTSPDSSVLVNQGFKNLMWKATKKQGMALLNSSIYQSVGGNYSPTRDDFVDIYHMQGIQQFGTGGEVIGNYTHSPLEYIEMLKKQGKTAEIIEHEGLYAYKNCLYSLVVYKKSTSSNSEVDGIALIEYGSDEKEYTFKDDSKPFTTPNSRYNPHKSIINNRLINEYDGSVLSSIKDVVQYMAGTYQKEITFYTTGLELLDVDNEPIEPSQQVTITNQNNYTFFVEYKSKGKIVDRIVLNDANRLKYEESTVYRTADNVDILSIDYNDSFYSTNTINYPPNASSRSGFVDIKVRNNIKRVYFRPFNSYDEFLNIKESGVWRGWKEITYS